MDIASASASIGGLAKSLQATKMGGEVIDKTLSKLEGSGSMSSGGSDSFVKDVLSAAYSDQSETVQKNIAEITGTGQNIDTLA